MRILLVSALVVLAAMAGCADSTDAISAREGLAPAREAARAHGDDPVLVGIASIEPFRHMAEEDHEVWVHLDKNPGDGRAPGWMYMFASGDRTIGVLYAAGLGVIAEGYETMQDDSESAGEPIADWVLDSTDVARVLAKLPGWPAASDDTTVFWRLQQGEDGPAWFVEWDNATTSTEAMVDARTGNVSQVDAWEHGGMVDEICYHAVSAGGGVSPVQEVSLSVEVAHRGHLEYTFTWDMTLGEATMAITGPEGEVDRDTLSGSGQGFGSLADLAGGTYTLEIQADLGLGQASGLSMWSCG